MFTKKKKAFDLHQYLLPDCIVFSDANQRLTVLEQMVDRLYRSGKIHEKLLFTHALLAREAKGSTALGQGIAVPHTRSRGHEEFFLSVGIVKNSCLIWDEEHPDPIHFVFVIGGPEDRPEDYLALLAHLTEAVQDPKRRDQLLLCETADQVFASLSRHEST